MASESRCNESFDTAFLQLHNLIGALTKLEERAYLHKAGITYQQYLILIAVESNGPKIHESVIAKQVLRNLNTVSMIVDRMEKNGLLERNWSEVDRRKAEVKLTKKGKEALRRALKVGAELKQHLGCRFTSEEIEQLTELVNKLKGGVFQELDQEVPPPDLERAMKQRVIRLHENAPAVQA